MFMLSAAAPLDALFSVAPGSTRLWHPTLPCVSTWMALPTVPADVASSSRHHQFHSQQYLWWHDEPDGDLCPPCKNGFLSLQPTQFFPIWLIAQPWGKLCQYRGGVMWRREWVPRGVWESERWLLSSFPAAYETTGWASATPCVVVSFYIFQHLRFIVAHSVLLCGPCCFVLEIPASSAYAAVCPVHGRSVARRSCFHIGWVVPAVWSWCYTGLRLGLSSRGCPLSSWDVTVIAVVVGIVCSWRANN